MGVSHIARQEFDDHAQDEHRPEDVQDLQHTHQPVEEVEAKEGGVESQRVHKRRMYDPEWEDKGRTESPVRATYSQLQQPIERSQEAPQWLCCCISRIKSEEVSSKFRKILLNKVNYPFTCTVLH